MAYVHVEKHRGWSLQDAMPETERFVVPCAHLREAIDSPVGDVGTSNDGHG